MAISLPRLLLSLPSCLFLTHVLGATSPTLTEKDVLEAMKRATDFMMNKVSNRGGFLWYYSADLAGQWGEVPALKSQIWVQPPPNSSSMGEMLLDAYKVTKDSVYLKSASKAADALAFGQHPSGGWHYFIDFEPAGIPKFYEEVASQCRGWEEFYYYYGNATFDDDTTASAARFLLRLYATTLDPKYKEPLLKALNFILESQYPAGGWPQRYPLRHDFAHDDHPDYSSFYTYNDGVISNNIYLLLEAYEKLGNEEHRKAAYRGMDFYIISQLPSPQAGWAQQYDMDLKPAWARSYEPAALCSSQTVDNIKDLQTFYLITGDRRYLRPIPEAIEWLERSAVSKEVTKGEFTHAIYYELRTNQPLYIHHAHREGTRKEILRFSVNEEPIVDLTYGRLPQISIQALRSDYERVAALNAEEAMREYQSRGRHDQPARSVTREEATNLIASMDARGAWLTEIKFLDILDYVHNPPTTFLGIDTGTYVNNMYELINFVRYGKKVKD
jgi:PelA/Pel-15E family pectate lyase